ncbi:MAG: hypothetical protein PVJ49_00295 [Acidobacteriota bacterium]
MAAADNTPAATDGARGSRLALAAFVLLLVVIAFARAHFASSTGIRIGGDGADYQAMATSMSLEGRAPFAFRPAAPLLVGALFGGSLMGFVVLCALAMFAALYTTGALAPDGLAGYGIVAVLFFNYQVLFAAANPARIDVLVLAVQLGFVALALRGRSTMFLALLPLCALLKESLLLSLGALALIAFGQRRELWGKMGASAAGFLALHLVVRAAATPTASMPPYDGGMPVVAAAWSMLSSNLSLLTPLDFFIAWGGLCCIAGWLAFGGGAPPAAARELLLPASSTFLLLFPLPLVTDVHRAWFELLAPTVFFLLLPALTRERRSAMYPALVAAMAASILPYAVRFVATDHLYLLILERRLSAVAVVGLLAALAAAGAALAYWRRAPTPAAS